MPPNSRKGDVSKATLAYSDVLPRIGPRQNDATALPIARDTALGAPHEFVLSAAPFELRGLPFHETGNFIEPEVNAASQGGQSPR